MDNLKLLDLLGSQESRASLALGMFDRDTTKTLADLVALSLEVKNGYYDYQQYRDDTAVTLAPMVKSVSVDGIKKVIGTIGGHEKRKKVALILLAKKATVSKEDIQSIAENIKNGYYDYQAYKTQFLSEAMGLIK